jgi:hypothetical protein
MSAKAASIERCQKRLDAAEAEGRTLPASALPSEGRIERHRLIWMCVGGAVMACFLFARTRLFWWPHPVGYVMWMGTWTLTDYWFSFFLGWLVKLALIRFCGQRVFLSARRFFIGILVGEALAAVFWIFVAWLTDQRWTYKVY